MVLFIVACSAADAKQPLPFNHKVHVVDHGMNCVDCHIGVKTAAWAGMPTVDDCLRCHAFRFSENARALSVTERAQKLVVSWERLSAIVPHAHVSHAAHVAAKVACKKCHGGIGTSERARREQLPEGEALMVWCIDCHEQKNASTDCVTCHR